MLRGAEDLRHVCERKISHNAFEVTPDGKFSWEEVECLGACVNAPLVMIGSDTYEDLTPESLEAILDEFAAGKGAQVKPGPQVVRQYGAAEGGQTTLLEKPTAQRTYKPFPPPPEAAPAPGAAAPAPAAAKGPEPTTAARPKNTTEETAPALKSPSPEKVSTATAESERQSANASAKADGEPNKAMRETATGAESPAGKIDEGKAPGKPRRGKTTDAVADPDAISPTRETGRKTPKGDE
jgi:NADH-quinone oxidoreductase subunit E